MTTSFSEPLDRRPALSRGVRIVRAVEFAVIFFLLPGVIAFGNIRVPLLPLMWGLAVAGIAVLVCDASFDRRRLWNLAAITRRDLGFVLGRFAVLAVVLAGVLWIMRGRTVWGLEFPGAMFTFPRARPAFWLLVMVAYPLLSVLPQNVVWRVFLFHRYRGVFGDRFLMVVVSAAAFGWAHIVMNNWFAVVTTLVGGLFFAQTYRRSDSMLLASVEHALYGCWMFTVGYGLLFLYGELPPEALEMMRGGR